jgi:nicotinate-nucleotide adenylyltransferase
MQSHPGTLGIFGGTFDPPHHGHLIVASHVREAMNLDRIMFVPAAVPPHKRGRQISPGAVRLAMVEAAVKGDPYCVASSIELDRGGVSYTIDTVRALREKMPSTRLSVLIGMDNLIDFESWREPEAILREASVVVMTRPGYAPGPDDLAVLGQMHLCAVPHIDIAGREIRRRVAEGKSIRYLVPEAVEQYIREHALYR